MILNIYIKSFLMLSDIELSFNRDGIISGESGSGKSIIIKAIAYLYCLHDIDNADVKGEVLIDNVKYYIHRVNNEYFINDIGVSKSKYHELVKHKVEIIDQNFNTILLNSKNHINIVDSFIDDTLKSRLKSAYNLFIKENKRVKELEKFISLFDYNYAIFQVEELSSIDIDNNEYDELIKQYSDIKQINEYNEKYNECYMSLMNNNSLYIVEDAISKLVKLDDKFNKYLNICDLANDITKCYKSIDSEDLLIKDKLDRIQFLMHKYQKNCNELLMYKEKLNNDIEIYQESRCLLTERLETLSIYKKDYDDLANDMHNKRVDTITYIEDKFNMLIKKLGMNKCKIRIKIKESNNIGCNGYDVISIFIDINGNNDFKSITNKISGGEMSRVIFVIISILIEHSKIKLLILDEIDTGLSGNNAIQLAKQIKKMCKDTQLLCISHSPIICSYTNNHYYVSKIDNNITVKKLTQSEVLERIAFLSNISVNKETVINASNIIKIIQDIPS